MIEISLCSPVFLSFPVSFAAALSSGILSGLVAPQGCADPLDQAASMR